MPVLFLRLERIYLAADVPAPRVASLMRELFPDCRFVKPIGRSLLVRDDESTLLKMFHTLYRVGLVDSRRMERPFGGFFDHRPFEKRGGKQLQGRMQKGT
jgi:hypothetical protein